MANRDLRSLARTLVFFLALAGWHCRGATSVQEQSMDQKTADSSYAPLRRQMVREQLEGRDIRDRLVLRAMETVPRHLFVPPDENFEAYADRPLPIGEGQTISQPYIVALMSQLLGLKGGEKILEIGTGSGYQAAVLDAMGARVFSIEIICTLADRARQKLAGLGYKNIQVRCADGYRGWPEEAPFDGVIVTAAPTHVPQPLVDQLRDGGRLVIPVGDFSQELVVITKHGGKAVTREVIPVRFVPMTGEAEKTRGH